MFSLTVAEYYCMENEAPGADAWEHASVIQQMISAD